MAHRRLEPRSLTSLKAQLRSIDEATPGGELDAIAEWTYQPMALLNHLGDLAARVVGGDRSAASLLFTGIEQHARSHRIRPSFRRSFGPGAGGPIPLPDQPCGPSPLPQPIGEIGLAIALATTGDRSLRTEMLDGLRDLAYCTQTFQVLEHSLDSGELELARHRIRALRDEGRFGEPGRVGLTPFPDGPGGPGPDGPYPIGPDGPGPGPIPDPCPPPLPDPCDFEWDFCLRELIDFFKHPIDMPDGSHISAEGITGISSGVCAGGTIRITGSGFGDSQPAHIRVIVAREVGGVRRCEEAEVLGWSATKIDVRAPAGVISGCVGFLDVTKLAEEQEKAKRANVRIQDLNSLSACLRLGGIRLMVPIPSENDCPPCTDANRLVAGPPGIVTFRGVVVRGASINDNGYDGVSTIEPGDELELRWLVDNADSVEIERTSAQGPRFAGSTTVTNPPGNSYGLGVANHTTRQVWEYRLTATNACGTTTKTVVVAATKDPGIRFGSIEVTQGIQTPTGSVKLVADKRTVVRVFWNHGLAGFDGDVLRGVTGELSVYRSGSYVGKLQPINGSSPTAAVAGATIDIPATPNRDNVDDSLNFLVPAAWCNGTLSFTARARIDDFGAAPGEPGSGIDDSGYENSGSYTFRSRTPVSIEYLRVRWRGGGTLRTPTAANCEATLINSMQRVAAPIGTISEHPDSPLRPGGTHNDDRMEDLLDDWDDRHRCEIRDAILAATGLPLPFPFILPCFDVNPSTLNAIGEAYWALMPGSFYRGRAADIPANTYSTPARTATNTGWTAFNLDTKAAHELTHCLDQLHIELCGAGGGDDADELSNNSLLNDVAFDIDGNDTVVGATDLMSYCNPRWSHPDRWARVYGYVGG